MGERGSICLCEHMRVERESAARLDLAKELRPCFSDMLLKYRIISLHAANKKYFAEYVLRCSLFQCECLLMLVPGGVLQENLGPVPCQARGSTSTTLCYQSIWKIMNVSTRHKNGLSEVVRMLCIAVSP
jgi:hypothetical protein